MKPKSPINVLDQPIADLRAEYDFDFSNAKRGQYAARLKAEGSNLIMLEPDLAQYFPDSASVNAALRSTIEIAKIAANFPTQLKVR